MRVTYRDAIPKDAAELDRIFDRSFCDTFAHLYRPEDLEMFLSGFGLPEWEAQLGDPACAFRIAEVDGQPVGYVKIGPQKLPVETARPALLLDQLYLLREHHGAGIAHDLMDLDHIETVTVNALGGTDTVTINDPTGSGVTLFNVNLGINGLGDGLSDTINIVDDDPVTVTNNGGGDITITGLSGATVHITGFEAANDHLVINGDIFAI